MNLKTLIIVLVGITAGLGGVWLGSQNSKPESLPMQLAAGAFVYPEPQVLPDFKLVDQDNKPFGLEQLQGKWSFIFFGYTYCPDICPMALTNFNHVYEKLKETERGVANASFVFVSVDPARDTPARLKEYVKFFNPEFIGATGSDEEIQKMSKSFNVISQRAAGGGENYLVDHSSAVMLMDPQGRRFAIFNAPHDAKTVTDAFEKIRDHTGV